MTTRDSPLRALFVTALPLECQAVLHHLKDLQAGFLTRPDVVPASHRLRQRALAEPQGGAWRQRIEPHSRRGEPSVFVKPIWSTKQTSPICSSTWQRLSPILSKH